MRPEVLGGSSLERQSLNLRFEREAQATASMRSPHTIELYDFGIADDGTFYYVMEFLDGFDLQALVEQRELNAADSLLCVPSDCIRRRQAFRFPSERIGKRPSAGTLNDCVRFSRISKVVRHQFEMAYVGFAERRDQRTLQSR